ncbi:MAG: LytTR family DNA-binding domain-containing protein [Lachnospiraceae bacterium]|jgi:DNA-binding LytR/AlgR family response regulator|nr:LytTR family DNA-binding domain-containing protein [Lachnospiraceae bacterium]
MIKIAVCDDDDFSCNRVKDIIAKTAAKVKQSVEIDSYDNALDVEKRIIKKQESLDILILDVDMPIMSGLELSENLRRHDESLLIIFLSAHEKYVFKALEFSPFRYVRKVCMEQELSIALEAAFRYVNIHSDKCVIVKTEDGTERLFLSQIMYYETNIKRQILICLNDKKTITTNRMTIKEMQEKTASEPFILLHRGLVVNARFIKSINQSIIILDDEQKLIISRPQLKEVKQKLLAFWGDLV